MCSKAMTDWEVKKLALLLENRVLPTLDRSFGSSRRLERTSRIGTVSGVFFARRSL